MSKKLCEMYAGLGGMLLMVHIASMVNQWWLNLLVLLVLIQIPMIFGISAMMMKEAPSEHKQSE